MDLLLLPDVYVAHHYVLILNLERGIEHHNSGLYSTVQCNVHVFSCVQSKNFIKTVLKHAANLKQPKLLCQTQAPLSYNYLRRQTQSTLVCSYCSILWHKILSCSNCYSTTVGATSSQLQKPSDSKKTRLKLKKIRICQNSKMVKTENFYKLGPKFFTSPQFL